MAFAAGAMIARPMSVRGRAGVDEIGVRLAVAGGLQLRRPAANKALDRGARLEIAKGDRQWKRHGGSRLHRKVACTPTQLECGSRDLTDAAGSRRGDHADRRHEVIAQIGSSDGSLGCLRSRRRGCRDRDCPWVVARSALRAVAGPVSGHRGHVRRAGRTTCSRALLSSSCSPSGFRPRTFEAVLMSRPLVILRRHSGPGDDLQRLHRCAALRACWAVLPVRGLRPAGHALQRGSHPSDPSEPPMVVV